MCVTASDGLSSPIALLGLIFNFRHVHCFILQGSRERMKGTIGNKVAKSTLEPAITRHEHTNRHDRYFNMVLPDVCENFRSN